MFDLLFRWLSSYRAQNQALEAQRRIMEHNERKALEAQRVAPLLGDPETVRKLTLLEGEKSATIPAPTWGMARALNPDMSEVDKRFDDVRRRVRVAPPGAKAQERTGVCIGGNLDGQTRTQLGLVIRSATIGDYWWTMLGPKGFWMHESLTLRTAVDALISVYSRR